MKKKLISLLLVALLAMGLAACGNGGSGGAEGGSGNAEPGKKILRAAASFAYSSIDVHKEYYGWYTSIYGVSEALFKMDENMSAVPCLAEDATAEGSVWTITLKDGVAFSNGNPLTAEMVIRNLKRLAEVNDRFAYYADFDMQAVDEKTLTIDTKEIYPTLRNELANPEFGMMDLDATTDFDNDPICTGPFVISKFQPEGDVEVVRNENYWGGDVILDGAIFYYMEEDDPKLLAMQSGEIDCYNSVSSAALAVYQQEPDKYKVVSIPGARLQFYIVNENRLDDAVREAITLIVDKEKIASYMEGTVSPAVGPFNPNAPYGQVTVPKVDVAKAKKILEEDGYVLGADGFYAKDGQKLTIKIAYYSARSLDTIATLMKEQFAEAGIDTTLRNEEDPDATYIVDADYDLALYCMIADRSGDPLYFIESTLKEGSYYSSGGFHDEHCEELIGQLKYETDPDKRAELANEIVQIAIDDNAFGYVGLFNNTTVLRPGVSGFAEDIPFDFYGIDANTTIG